MKLLKISFLIIILGICCYGDNSRFFNPSVKVGMNIGWINSIHKKEYIEENYCYPRAVFAICNKIKIFNTLFLRNDLMYRESYSVAKYYPAGDYGPLFLNYKNKWIQISIISEFQVKSWFNVFGGVEYAKQLDYELFEVYRKRNGDQRYYFYTKPPKKEYALSMGLSKDFNFMHNNFFIETRYFHNMTEFKLETMKYGYKNHILMFFIGYKL